MLFELGCGPHKPNRDQNQYVVLALTRQTWVWFSSNEKAKKQTKEELNIMAVKVVLKLGCPVALESIVHCPDLKHLPNWGPDC